MSRKQGASSSASSILHLLAILLLLSGCAAQQAVQSDPLSNKVHLLAANDFVSKIIVSHTPVEKEPEKPLEKPLQKASGPNGTAAPELANAIHEGGEMVFTSSLSEKVYAHAEAGVLRETRRQLRQTGRWKGDGGVEMHLKITHLRLRRTAAQLLLYLVAGNDEMRANVTLSRHGKVIASDTVSTRLGSGGVYGTFTLSKRVNMLAQQLARKLVRARL